MGDIKINKNKYFFTSEWVISIKILKRNRIKIKFCGGATIKLKFKSEAERDDFLSYVEIN